MTKAGAAVFNFSATNEPYSEASGNFNPIHVNSYFADLAGVSPTITHSMWSSSLPGATLRRSLCKVARSELSRKYDVAFVGMVIPGDELRMKTRHSDIQDGNTVVKVETFNDKGSQEQGMAMDFYKSAPAARSVWDAADIHLTAVYGFSIIEIVKDNLEEKTIHFGGIKGQAMQQRHMYMNYDNIDGDGSVKTLLLHIQSSIWTLVCHTVWPIAQVMTERAVFEDMRSKDFV
ncbi:hypothetical protein SCP_1502000 [Sparassis crispa]|uniref:MaoC-like domain-containing protein n=1 Tax=Sparassis crispa TaxID=139825 RepID=A0A401H448_9APHY|nr:hypothetical protein SCP_1502000 [Sparassis crispa]GBE89192.1 hypothetical protein SCP_1502000 [Sparassis crispa]